MSPNATSIRQWTLPQLAAIAHRQGNLLVSAAAGSGKTAVLAERCARLISDGAADGAAGPRTGVENLLVLTFTDAAAAEMRTRIAGALAEKLLAAPPPAQGWLRRQVAMVDRASISTLHAFCMRLLRQHFHEAQVDPGFEIIDPEETRLLQEETLDELLAAWHRLPATGAPVGLRAEDFGAFFEAYGQGSAAVCRHLILSVHRMLASAASPDAYRALSRGLYGDGAGATFDAYQREVLANRLRLARERALRLPREVQPLLGAEKLAAGLENALTVLDDSADKLDRQGAAAWQGITEALTYKWPNLQTVQAISDWAGLKERTWQSMKDELKELAGFFAPDPAKMRTDLQALGAPLETLLELVRQFDEAFTAAKRADNRLDFADLERRAFDLLNQPGSQVQAEVRRRYHFVLVDEFQDINPLQAGLLEAVSRPGGRGSQHLPGNLFVVGDIKQSIYGFRLAQPELFYHREQAARAALAAQPEAPPEYIALSHNFRSHPDLLGAMNRIFERILTPEVARIDYPKGHALQPPPVPAPAPPKGKNDGPAQELAHGAAAAPGRPFAGTPVEMHLVVMDAGSDDDDEPEAEREDLPEETNARPWSAAPSERLNAVEQEAQVVAARIAALLAENRCVREKGQAVALRPRHIAILLRTMRNKAMVFARALAARGIGVHADLSSGFFETSEVKNTLALLDVLDNPQQDIPLATVLLGPYGQFTHDDLARIRLAFDPKEVSFAQAAANYPQLCAGGGEAWAARAAGALDIPPAEELGARLAALWARLERWRGVLRVRPLHEGLAEIFDDSKILAYVAGLDTGMQRVANLQLLHQRALKFATFKKQGLHRFLRFIEKLREREEAGFGGRSGGGGDFGEAPVLSEASDVVRILSVHKSKGLEFPVVFVSGLGGKLQMTTPGPVLLHQDLGIGLHISDVERNVSYPSAAALRIAEDQRRGLRAEELRLLYVALTRARECLILSGHVAKAAHIDRWRQAWRDHRGPLPEDVLLKGTRALDWLMPALATGCDVASADEPANDDRMTICWGGEPAGEDGSERTAQVVVQRHMPERSSEAPRAPEAVNDLVEKLLVGQPLPEVAAHAEVALMIRRVTGRYAFAAAAQRPAVQTVSFLKAAEAQREAAEEVAAPVAPDLTSAAETAGLAAMEEPSGDASAIEAARLRGVATHHILELLDFARCDSQAALEEQIDKCIRLKRLTTAEAQRADVRGIGWFLWHSAAGLRVVQAARAMAAGDGAWQLRREIAFTWLGGESHAWGSEEMRRTSEDSAASDPADCPTIRGVIDLLLVNTATRAAEIIDYKTDSLRLWESRCDDYQRQMRHYLAAASDILGFGVRQATLIFLAPRREIVVPRA